jgi:hypothetical protein
MPTNNWRVTVDDDLAIDLEAYCRANEAADRLPIIRKAIKAYIDDRLRDRGVRKRFDAERSLLLAKLPTGLRLVHNKKAHR